MTRQIFLVLSVWVAGLSATSMRRIAQIPSGPYSGSDGRVVCCDSDHDSLPELVFHTGTIRPSDLLRNEDWEHRGWNRFSLVFADTGEYPEPPGITTGNAIPFAAGDIDDDGLTDIVCIGIGRDSTDSIAYDYLITIESPDSFSYPCSLSWYYRFSDRFVIPIPIYYPPDLDYDGHKEILCVVPSLSMGFSVWENTGNDQHELVWRDTTHDGYRLTFGDFDMDGRMDFATARLGSSGTMSVWECAGDDQYEVVFQDMVYQPNGADLFTTNDIDGDGKPEFYVAYENVPRGKMYLYMWEADQEGTDVYHRTLVDSLSFVGDDWGRISECGDIDGDGIDECIWTTPDIIKVYKAVGDDQLQEVWHWDNDHGGFRSLVSTVYDINGDGYNELIAAGNAKISVFEVDAVDLVSPNRGAYNTGDTVPIRWATHSPPRCDSVSLLLRVDTLWHYQTIARGLPGTDTLYLWVVPGFPSDTGRFVVVAYGPGWQYDISDSVIDFTGGGVAEGTHSVPLQWALSVSPNPARGAFTVRYDVPLPLTLALSQREREGVREDMSLGIYDAGGRLVRSLSERNVDPGRYEVHLPAGVLPAGIYFLRLDTPGFRSVKKAVVTR
jgi:hypothetical protein